MTFNPATRELSGTPTEVIMMVEYTYQAHDADGDRSMEDAASLSFLVTVEEDTPPRLSARRP